MTPLAARDEPQSGAVKDGVRLLQSPKAVAASLFLGAAFSLALVPASFAQSPTGKRVAEGLPAAPAAYARGEVRKIDSERGVVMLKHGPIEHMGMPGMTMTFHLARPEQAAGLKVGDQVSFRVEKIAGTLFVVELTSSR